MLHRFVKSLDDVPEDHRQYYAASQTGGFTLLVGLEELADEFNRAEAELGQFREGKHPLQAELAELRTDEELSNALAAENVPGKFHNVLKARLRAELQDGASAGSAVTAFLATDEGQAYRGKQEAAPHFTARLRLVQ